MRAKNLNIDNYNPPHNDRNESEIRNSDVFCTMLAVNNEIVNRFKYLNVFYI